MANMSAVSELDRWSYWNKRLRNSKDARYQINE